MVLTHGVSVPREGQADLVSGIYYSILAWLKGLAGWLSAFFKLGVGRSRASGPEPGKAKARAQAAGRGLPRGTRASVCREAGV